MRLSILSVLLLSLSISTLQAADYDYSFSNSENTLRIEVWNHDLIHAEYGLSSSLFQGAIRLSPMVANNKRMASLNVQASGNRITTDSLDLSIDQNSLCLKIFDRIKNRSLTTLCPGSLKAWQKSLSIDASQFENAYGLGENFRNLGSADGDWVSLGGRNSLEYGNGFQMFQEAAVGNIQIPILYAVGDQISFGFFLDNIYKQDWGFSAQRWYLETRGDQLRFFLIAGRDLKDLRSKYLNLTGRPPVLPKKSLGLWMSKFGYHSWKEIDDTKQQMRKRGIPFDGFVLDINWFGSIDLKQPQRSRMGFLEWDQSNSDGNDNYFPDPATRLRNYLQENIGFTIIEESYVVNSSPTYRGLADNKLFAFQKDNWACNPNGDKRPMSLSAWWGNGGMIDWSNPGAGVWMHDNKRFPNLIRLGVTNHWTDLGEPEMFSPDSCYVGVEEKHNFHQDVHNVYNLLWNKSIWEGYKRHNSEMNKRPFIMTRSGSAGTQRYGAGVWSADIASNLQSLATHMNAHMHMSLSGIDYFSSDAGGFRKEIMPGNDKSGRYRGYENEMYSMWLANSAWFDIPLRPHTDNDFSMAYAPSPLWPPYETAPYLVGKEYSNKMNIWQRYELVPYYYSLAYRAHLFGEAVMPPLVYHYQNDKRLRTVGHQKMIGPNIMVGVVASHGEYARNVILPQDGWYNYHTNEYFDGERISTIRSFPVYIDEVLRVPTFVREGSIIPLMKVSNSTMDVFNHQTQAQIDLGLVVKVYQGPDSQFTLYEDDGTTMSFEGDRPVYDTKKTLLTQKQTSNGMTVTIEKTEGLNAPLSREVTIRVVLKEKKPSKVLFGGVEIPFKDLNSFDSTPKAWTIKNKEVFIKLGAQSSMNKKQIDLVWGETLSPTTNAYFVCKNGWTQMGENIVLLGETEKLGLAKSSIVKLEPSVYYDYIWNPPTFGGSFPGPKTPTWTKLFKGIPANQKINWSCAKTNGQGKIISQGKAEVATINTQYSGSFESSLDQKK